MSSSAAPRSGLSISPGDRPLNSRHQKQVQCYEIIAHADGDQSPVANAGQVFGMMHIVVIAVGHKNTEWLERLRTSQALNFLGCHTAKYSWFSDLSATKSVDVNAALKSVPYSRHTSARTCSATKMGTLVATPKAIASLGRLSTLTVWLLWRMCRRA